MKSKTKKIGPFASEVYRIIDSAEGPVTAGEVFAVYRDKYPTTNRARNEIAKRVNDLANAGAIEYAGRGVCPVTGEKVQLWASSGDTTDMLFSELPAEPEDESPEAPVASSREELAAKVTAQYGERCAAMDPDDEQFLRTFRSQVDRLLANKLLAGLIPAQMVRDAEKLKKALRYF